MATVNPAKIESFPPTFPMELAMRIKPIPDLCKAYGINRDEWNRIRHDPAFIQALEMYVKEMEDPKAAFRMKARLQSEVLLNTSWDLIHSSNAVVAPPVKADLIKATWKAAGLGEPKEQVQLPVAGLQINILMRNHSE